MSTMVQAATRFLVGDERKSLKRDNNGAIMVLGIFMACAMIGLTWEFIGLGDAMIWRDRSQEAADAAATARAIAVRRRLKIAVTVVLANTSDTRAIARACSMFSAALRLRA